MLIQYRFLLLCIAFVFSCLESLKAQDCECTNCPQFMPDLFVGDFNLNVQNASNPTLGQNGQGVCGVIVHFDHTALCDISISLTSPSGQSVTLVGPIGQFCTSGGNTGTDWNVTFLPCGSGAVPDAGFSDQWNNNQNWGGGNIYTGSYYPFGGCLQNLSGPVNGNWTLTVVDGQANDVGNLYDFEIIFCDPGGISCFSCAADAGALTQADVMFCQGVPELSLDLPPTYNPPTSVEPPSSDYTYAYIISGLGGVIQAISPTPDLSAFPAGNYNVCGFSYLTAQQNLVPAPNGSLSVTTLSNQLNSNTPPFCGNITSNCVNVTIMPLPPDTEETAVVCSPECVDFFGDFYCQTGDYTVEQMDANGCIFNAVLHLTVNQPSFQLITEIACPGGCSTNPAFPNACAPGQYIAQLTNTLGCDSFLTLTLSYINVDAVIQPPAMLTCTQNSVLLSGQGSVGSSYLWSASNGGNISGPNNQITATATTPGTYKLKVCRTQAGVTCCDSTTVNVTSNIVLPNTPIINGNNTICVGDTQVYVITPVAAASGYTWTVPVGATILSGQNDTLLTVLWNGPSGGDICVTATNACGSSQPACITVSALDVPAAPVVTGELLVCRDSTVLYVADSIPGATAYNWQVTGGSGLSGNGFNTVRVIWNGSTSAGTVCATATNACGQSVSTCLNVTIQTVPALPVISGTSNVCVGTTANYFITALNGASGYVWTVPIGATIVSGQNSPAIVVNWSAAPGGNVCVYGVNDCGAGAQACFPVSAYTQPNAYAGPDTALCALMTNLAAVPSVAGSTGQWAVLSGTGVVSFANANIPNTWISVNINGAYQFIWTETNGTCSDADTVQINFNESPLGGTPLPACDGANLNYTISFTVTGGTPPYLIPGGTLTNNLFTSVPIPNGQSYIFSIADANGCPAPIISGVFNCNCATNAGQMNQQPLIACAANTVTAQVAQGTNFDTDDVGAFILHSNSGAVLGSVFMENTSGIFGYVTGMTFGTTYYISYVVGNNLNGSPNYTDPCLSVAPGQPVVFYDNPVANAGIDVSGCALNLMVNGSAASGTSLWSVVGTPPGGSVMIASPQNAVTSVTASMFGVYALSYTVTSNGCIGADTIVLDFNDSPLTGPITEVCDGVSQEFTVSFDISGGQMPYLVGGQAVVGSTFTSMPLPNGSSFNFVVSDANGCTSGNVSGSYTCNCATSAGQVSLSPITACQSDSISVQVIGGQNLDADDVAAYVLHTGSGATLGNILFQNTTGKFGYWATMTFGATYYVSAVAGNNLNGFPDPNDPCYSVSAGQPIVFIQNPTPDAGENFVVCGLTANLPAKQGLFPGSWVLISGPGTANFGDNASPVSPVTVTVPGSYIFRWSEVNGICAAVDEVEALFLDNPVVSGLTAICNGTNTGYVLSFTVTNGAGSYVISGVNGAFNGSTFSSFELPNNSSYTFQVQDQFGCQSPVMSGSYLCNCSTSAGTMGAIPAIFCADAPATALWNNDGNLDADDAVQFILHDQAGPALGNVLAIAAQPVFNFGPGLQTGVTYYISAIAGNNLSGAIDLNDPCLSIAPGTPVQWKALPTATISGDATICAGSSTVLNFNGTGTFPLQLIYTDSAGIPTTLNIPNPQTVPLFVTPTLSTVYSLLSVTDGSAPTCSVLLNNSVTVQVNQPTNAGVANAPEERCFGMAPAVQLSSLITGEFTGGQWSETSAVPSILNAFNAVTGIFNSNGQAPGTYTFRYYIQAGLPCPSQSTTVSVIIHPVPIANAGEDQMIDCHQDTVILGGSGTSVGPDIQHQWRLAGTPVGNTPILSTAIGGNYTLLVTNAFGCTATDAAAVEVNDDIPFAKIITVTSVGCFGENNGSIELDSIVSRHQPVLFSLNGGPFELDRQFNKLEPGPYWVTLLDNNGCEWRTDTLQVTEPALMTLDLGGEIITTFGDSVVLEANTNVPISTLSYLQWKPLYDTLRANTYMQRFLPLVSRYVTLELVDSNGCKVAATALVRVEKPEQVYIPNIIKPGSIGLNDRLIVYGGRGVAAVELFRIFDRWGNQLFEATNFQPNDPGTGWDGAYRGDPVSPGVYVYVARVRFIDGAVEIYKGDVTVLR